MALLVIVCGALLMIGGAAALLMGFDIVMTERGSAMTLGGVMALSGGVIAVGIGFALLRLSQILAALQERTVRGVRPVVTPDRPVVPLAPAEPAISGDPPPAAAGSPAVGVGIGTGAVAAGLAASAAVMATGHSSAAASGRDMQEPDAGPPSLNVAPAAAAPHQPGGSIPDLEEELARALAEPGSKPSPVAAREKSFSDGLSDLLTSPKIRKRKNGPDADAEPEAEHRLEAESGSFTHHEPASAELMRPEPAVETTADADETDESLIEPDAPGEISAEASGEAAADVTAAEAEAAVADTPKAAHAADDQSEDDLAATPPSPPIFPSRKVLGTYNAGGRTYSMYADGSVEAMTESGVERFNSMDELRRHLVKA